MKLYRLFRHKKYGELIEPPQVNLDDSSNQITAEDIVKDKAKKGGKRKASQINNQDLITVMEDAEESGGESERDLKISTQK